MNHAKELLVSVIARKALAKSEVRREVPQNISSDERSVHTLIGGLTQCSKSHTTIESTHSFLRYDTIDSMCCISILWDFEGICK